MIRDYEMPLVAIPAEGTTSNAFVTKDFAWGSYQIPAMVGASVKFAVSNDGSNFAFLNDATGTPQAAVPIGAGQITPFPDELFYHAYAKIVSASTETAQVNITVLVKG